MKLEQIDLIGSHGLTVYHMPKPIIDDGFEIRSTLQIGEPSVISERTGIVTVADFRVRDVAAGGEGAPLVPYTEYILYRDKDKSIGLQNIGGIANITVLPKDCSIEDVYAFDNGPGNMIIDQLVSRITNNKMKCDVNGDIARQGTVNQQLLDILMNDDYLQRKPPKTTGREYFGQSFGDRVIDISKSIGISENDLVATATAYTAKAIGQSCKEFIIPSTGLDKLIIGGGGSYNRTLVKMIKSFLPNVLVLTQEDIGLNSDAKEAIAFAILANETINGNYNNVPGATGANKKVVMGKIII
jgi:anhydro-N-acetylmuramic acid kinase